MYIKVIDKCNTFCVNNKTLQDAGQVQYKVGERDVAEVSDGTCAAGTHAV